MEMEVFIFLCLIFITKLTEMCVRLQGFVGGQREELWNHREGCSRSRGLTCVCVCELGEGAGEVDESEQAILSGKKCIECL